MVSRLKAGRTTRRTRRYSTCFLCWTRCALQATSDVYSVSVVTHDLGPSSPTDTVGNVFTSPLQFSFKLLFASSQSTNPDPTFTVKAFITLQLIFFCA